MEFLRRTGIHRPSEVRLRRAHADSRLWGGEAASWATPAALAHELGLGGDRGEDPADTLGVAGEGTQRYVAMLGRQHHALDGGEFGGGELTWVGAGAGWAIVEGTGCGGVAPGMKTTGFEVEHLEDESEREAGLRSLDGAEDVRLGDALRESTAGKIEPGDAEQSQQESSHGGESSGSTVEPDDGLEKLLPVLVQGFDGHDWA
jgi:hypothetical protein